VTNAVCRSSHLLIAVLIVVISLLCFSYPHKVLAVSDNYTVTAVVAPEVEVIVDKSMMITRVVSNTNKSVIPTFYVDSVQGTVLPRTTALYNQFLTISHNGMTLRPGIVYNYARAGSSLPQHTGNKKDTDVLTTYVHKLSNYYLFNLRPLKAINAENLGL
jgi:hypothetical protein